MRNESSTVDAHQHFWDPQRFDYPWMTPDVAAIRRAFGPEDLRPALRRNGVDATVLVQATSDPEETRYLLEIASSTDFVAGVVGWVDLTVPGVEDSIALLKEGPGGDCLVGIRHQVHDEPDPEWLLGEDVRRGLRALGNAGLAFDFLIRTREVAAAVRTAQTFAEMRFVVDHIAKPPIATGEIREWHEAMEQFADLDNVCCKLSGMVTEAGREARRSEDFVPYVERVFGWFGEDRLMFGSDWPVCLLAATYDEVLGVLDHTLRHVSAQVRRKIYGENAIRFYELEV